ncbi:MAG TPA: efflux RND transporter periplasmic adaptor subunit [Candidatus Acidoferrales bacterium]|nr:efflux RND transporter periplasmic adaptor subunit [Candidatus Acidoferrales bacterium]
MRRHAASIAVLAGMSLAWAGCSSKEAPAPEPVVDVQVATVQDKTIEDVVTADAVLYPLHEASIVPKISAPVERYYVERGSRVHAGELMATLENKDLAAAVEQAKGAYDQAQAGYATSTQVDVPAQVQAADLNLESARQAMQAARQVYESRQKLYQAGAMARNLMEDSHVAYVQARSQYQIALAHQEALQKVGRSQMMKSAEGQLAAAKGNYLAAVAQLQYSEIRSPIDGVVTDRPLFEGQMASAGSPLMTVMDLSHVVARAYVSPQLAAQLRVGDSASLAAANNQPGLPGKVSVVSPAVDPNSTTMQVWVDAPNTGNRLKPGLTVQVRIVARTVKGAIVVPAAAVLTGDDGTKTVMVVGPERQAHQTTVATGIQSGSEVQIVKGLRPGQQVVTTGAYGLPDGTKVRITSGDQPGGGSAG